MRALMTDAEILALARRFASGDTDLAGMAAELKGAGYRVGRSTARSVVGSRLLTLWRAGVVELKQAKRKR